MRKVVIGSAGVGVDAPKSIANRDTKLLLKLSNLVAHCSITRYDDGAQRKPGWFTLKTYGSAWVVQMKDPDAAASLTVTAQSLDDALKLADELLGAETAPWEPDAFLTPKTVARKKG